MLPFLKWIGLRNVAEESADRTSQAFTAWRKIEKEVVLRRNKIILNYCGLVPKVRARLGHYTEEINSDLEGEGIIGLAYSVEKYDPEKARGKSFSAYAELWIREKMTAWLARSKVVSVSQQATTSVNRIRRKIEEIAVELGREPTNSELEEMMGPELSEMRGKQVSLLYLDAPIQSDDDSEATFSDWIGDDSSDSTSDILARVDRKAYLQRLSTIIAKTDSRGRMLLIARIGAGLERVENFVPRTPEDPLKVAKLRAAQRLAAALKKG